MRDTAAERETLEIPQAVRDAVDERDGGFCRMCGKFLGERRCIHHILFGGDRQGMGGRRHHDPDEMVSLCWLPGDMGCHQRAHSNKALWQRILLQVVKEPARVTGFQLLRWERRGKGANGARNESNDIRPRG